MKRKIIILILLTILITSLNYSFVFADDGNNTFFSALTGSYSALDSVGIGADRKQAISDWIHTNSEAAGFIYDALSLPIDGNILYNLLPVDVRAQINDSTDEDEVVDVTRNYILNNQTVTDNSVTNDSDINTFIKNWSDYYVSQQGDYYAKAFDLHNATNSFTDGSLYLALKDFIQNDNHLFRFYGWAPAHGGYFVATCNDTNLTFVESSSSNGRITVSLYNKTTWDAYPFTPNTTFDIYFYNSTSGEFEQNTTITYIPNNWYFVCDKTSNYAVVQNASYEPYLVSMSNTDYVQVFKTVQSLRDAQVGYSSYYYNNDVWSDFSSSSSDYVFSPTNINTVSYGDVITHIDSTYSDDDYYPTTSQTNNWIENKNEENITNGGGSGSGGDSSGDGIFDFLSDLGSVLGNLIKNLGQAITNILAGIADLVQSIVTDLPTVFFDFIGSLFGWLPEEWVTLLSLSLACMLIWGVVKVIRG